MLVNCLVLGLLRVLRHGRLDRCSGASQNAQMTRTLSLRITGAIGLVLLAFFLVSVDPFFGSTLTARPGFNTAAPPMSVNRFRKGDKLPPLNSSFSSPIDGKPAIRQDKFLAPSGLDMQDKVPVGCDPVFSQVPSPSAANIYGRCMV